MSGTTTLERPRPLARPAELSPERVEATLRRLEFTITGEPVAPARMDFSLCTSTTSTTSCIRKKQ